MQSWNLEPAGAEIIEGGSSERNCSLAWRPKSDACEWPNAEAQLQRPEGRDEKARKGASRNRDWRAVCCLWFCAHRVPGAVPAAGESNEAGENGMGRCRLQRPVRHGCKLGNPNCNG